ncbi:MAG TPA: aminodeoxychorismate/anthranilate synthase component II [Tepidisphaeraceae bacterium]|jgi:anthranilate synthase/aminodeoxychorismate synthase-like glutamine amidotransferase
MKDEGGKKCEYVRSRKRRDIIGLSMIVLIDNYDSFTYNLVQKLGEVAPKEQMQVFRNDKVSVAEVEAMKPTHIVISPGPCTPKEGGVSNEVIKHFGPKIPVLGVCLGHQCIGFVHGAIVERAAKLMHGKTDQIHHDGRTIYQGMPNPFTATRYHSLIIRNGTLPADFEISAWTSENEIMGVRHKIWPLEGVQYHPESFLTEQGEKLLANFLKK